MSAPEPILFCWSGGKDSAMALHALLQREQFRVTALLTTVTEGYERISMHAVRRDLDDSFFRDLPPSADPCGENGEFHTFVFDGPIFRWPIPVRTGEIVHRDGFVYCDLIPEIQGVASRSRNHDRS